MFSERMKNLSPYVPGEQPRNRKFVKLNTNENPYPPSPDVQELLKGFDAGKLRLYPDPLFTDLRQVIADRYHIDPKQVFVGNGSDEVLAFAFYAFFDSINGDLLFPEHTYSFYPVYCDFHGINYKKLPLKGDFSIDLSGFLASGKTSGVIFPNPNAPTGMLIELAAIEELMEKLPKDRVVLIDEAYIDFGGESAVSLIGRFKNLLVVKTYSKSLSLAGIRIGFAMGDEKLIDALFAVKDSFNSYPADVLSLAIAEIAMKDVAYYDGITERIIKSRETLTRELAALGWEVLPSKANFVFARKEGLDGREIYDRLREEGFLVRHFNTDGIRDFVRITIGTEEMTEGLTRKIKEIF